MTSLLCPFVQIDPPNAAFVSKTSNTVDSVDMETSPLRKMGRIARSRRPVACILVVVEEALDQIRALLYTKNLNVTVQRQALFAGHSTPPFWAVRVPMGAIARLVKSRIRYVRICIRRNAQRGILALARQCVPPILRSGAWKQYLSEHE